MAIPSDHDPLTEAVYLILLALVTDALHGYAIMQEVAAISQSRVQLSTGTLYAALKRLLDNGWIERMDSADASRSKKIYRLTSLGRDVLATEAERMRNLAALAQKRLLEGG